MTDEWTTDLFHTIDSMDVPSFAKAFAEDGTFRFGNSPPVGGREQVEQAVAGFFSTLGGLKHHVTGMWSGTWEHGDVKIVESDVVYTRSDGTVTDPLPVVSILRMQGALIQDYRITMDVTPLFAQ
jgi:hypothetical protein